MAFSRASTSGLDLASMSYIAESSHPGPPTIWDFRQIVGILDQVADGEVAGAEVALVNIVPDVMMSVRRRRRQMDGTLHRRWVPQWDGLPAAQQTAEQARRSGRRPLPNHGPSHPEVVPQ